MNLVERQAVGEDIVRAYPEIVKIRFTAEHLELCFGGGPGMTCDIPAPRDVWDGLSREDLEQMIAGLVAAAREADKMLPDFGGPS